MVKAGIIDPLKVVRTALVDAARSSHSYHGIAISALYIYHISYILLCVKLFVVLMQRVIVTDHNRGNCGRKPE